LQLLRGTDSNIQQAGQLSTGAPATHIDDGPDRIEPHYSPEHLAARLAVSTDTIRRMFVHEPGVVLIGKPSRREGRVLKRRYFTMRIPASIAERVIARMAVRKQ
jgi:hypothetical protein